MTTKTEPKKQRRLTPRQWAEAEALWESGEMTQADIGRKFGINEQTVYMHMKRGKIKRGAKAEAHKKKVAEEVSKASIDDATITAARIRETKEEHYKMAAGLAKLAWAEVLKAKQDNAPLAVATNNLKAIDAAMSIMTKARQERWAVLGLDRADFVDEDGLPELLISELTADQIQALRNRDAEFDELPDEDLKDGDMVFEES
jgi:DNA-binding CsgD family transcriptional regulator